jgi:hypothetical protein
MGIFYSSYGFLSYGNLEWKPFHGAVEAEVENERILQHNLNINKNTKNKKSKSPLQNNFNFDRLLLVIIRLWTKTHHEFSVFFRLSQKKKEKKKKRKAFQEPFTCFLEAKTQHIKHLNSI